MSVPKPPPPPKADRHYNFRSMNIVFAIGSLALLAVTLWMVFADYAKPWKRLQAEFRGRERQQLAEQAEAEKQKLDSQAIAQVEADIAQQKASLDEQAAKIRELEEELSAVKASAYERDATWRQTKSLLDTARYQYGEAILHADPAVTEEHRREVEELQNRFRENKITLEEATTRQKEIEEQLASLRSGLESSEKRLAALEQGATNLGTRMKALDKDLDYFVLNAPLFDFLEPTLKIEQALLDGLYIDINFTTVNRVDRCMTCHVAANRPGFDNAERWAQPFRTHPRLDLFVSDTSPHPYTRFGCTICHAGLDRGTDFSRVGHTPASEQEREEWVQKWDWEPQKFLDYPILPAGTAEAGCVRCHATEVWTPGSEVQDVGRQLITKMGCYGCHVIEYPAFQDLRKAGPDLARIASKTTQGWTYKWLEAPRDFRPTTWMPHFFYEENVQGEANLDRQKAEIASIVAYLWDRSETVEYPEPPAGNAERGQALFESVGCTGCHIRDREATRDQFFPEINRLHGPNLVRTGSKVSAGWLYAWLKNPRDYFPESNMPNLRLTDQEAQDLTAYILSERDPAYENLSVPEVNAEIRDGLVLEYLQQKVTIEGSQARLAEMDEAARNVYLGEQTVLKYGCFGCHNISGFEGAKPIGTELTEEGSKPLHQLDFGHVHEVPHTRHDWIFNKLRTPRMWDRGKETVKTYNELYKMPNFGMSEQEAEAVLTNVLGFTKPEVVPERQAAQAPKYDALAAGRKLVTRYNCQGCHLIEGKGQAIRTALDRNLLPPNLAAEGARVHSEWLFTFLHNPGEVTLRPWLTARMPTFQLTDGEANTLVDYFAALDGQEAFLSPYSNEISSPRDRAVGEVVFNMLQCARCHPAGPAALAPGQVSAAELAPSLLLAQERLRWNWVPSWVKDPQGWIAGTKMPNNFEKKPDGTYGTPFEFAFDAPVFAPGKARLLPYFDSEEELKSYLLDADRVTRALRDHIWTLR